MNNLKIENTSSFAHSYYSGDIPITFKCPNFKSCANDNGNISGNCAKGYTGWLCTNCEPGFYSVLSSCVPCPSLAILTVESCIFVLVCAVTCFLLTWQVKRKTGEVHKRSSIDVIIARLKILLGFYQVIGEILTSLHDVNWTGPLMIMGKFVSAFEINLLRLFVRPRCFDMKLDLNPKIQFIIGAVSPVIIVLVPFTVYQLKKFYAYITTKRDARNSFQPHLRHLKTCCIACVVVLWFVVYPPVCSVIFNLYPLSCKSFSLNHDKSMNITRLRSDFDVDCAGLTAYHTSAYVLTIAYVIAFPLGLLYVLCKYHLLYRKGLIGMKYVGHGTHNRNEEVMSSLVAEDYQSSPSWLNFLCENYKRNFWFWEIVELARKVLQTLLITMFGWEDRLTVIITTIVSVVFLLLHARYRPMKSSYEQSLQMFSLTVIFINVVVAANDFPDQQEETISVVLVILNVIVFVIIAAELLITVIVHIKHFGVTKFIFVTLKRLQNKKRISGRLKTVSEFPLTDVCVKGIFPLCYLLNI